jgi:tRNA (cmo5U34)-methyltransferase
MRDQVFRDPRSQIVDFAFDDAVADVFPDMIRRSVPGYELVVPMTGLLAARHLREASAGGRVPRAYDLGCSLGATTTALLRQLGDAPAEIVAIDNSEAMVERARTLVPDPRVRFELADVREAELAPCRVVLLNYVLQFVPSPERLGLLERIRAALEPGGLLLLSEKIRLEDPLLQAEYDAAHLDFKRANGYSDLEISQKRTALENVMIVDTEEAHVERFRAAGFRRWSRWFQCLNWASFIVHA